MKPKMSVPCLLTAALALSGVLLTAGCNSSKETIAPDAGKPPSAAEKADEAKRESSGKM